MLKGITAIVTGASHIATGLECQDYVELEVGDDKKYAMAAAADGHGSKKHFRSAKGSEFATQAAKESIYAYMNDYEKFIAAYQNNKEFLLDKIIKMVITKWHEKIQEDLDQNPITQDEIDKYLDGNLNVDKIPSIYGTTLLVGVMSENCNFGFLIGDGSFVVIDKYGKAYIPIEDENSKANYTSSLSSSDSYHGFVKHFFDEMPFSIMVSTDGLVKSFGNDNDFLDYNQAIAMEIGKLDTQEKIDEMEERLIALFDQRSKDGSEDDISISIIFNSEGFETVLAGLKTRRSINKLKEQIEISNQKLVSLEFREKQILDEKRITREEINKLKLVRERLQADKKDKEEKIAKLKDQIEKLESNKKEIDEKSDIIEKKTAEEEEKYNSLVEKEKQCKEEQVIENQKKNDSQLNIERLENSMQ